MKKLVFILFMFFCINSAHATLPIDATYQGNNSLYEWVCKLFSPTASTIYYVSTGASGTNSGTLSNPWKTISDVDQSVLNAGDFVLFERGKQYSGKIIFTAGGTALSVLTFGAYGSGNNPSFIGTGATIQHLFYCNGPDYITITNIDVTDPTLNASDPTRSQLAKIQRVCTVDASSNHIVNDHMNVELVGVGMYTVGGNNTMSYCNYSNMRMVVDDAGGTNDYGANSITWSSSNNLVTHCVFSNLWAHSFDFGFDGGAIEIFVPSGTLTNNIIEYTFIDEGIGVSEITANTSGLIWRYNIIINNGSFLNFQPGYTHGGTDVLNNVFVLTKASKVGDTRLFYGDQVGITVTNNVFYMRANCDIATSQTGITPTFNYFNMTAGSTSGWTTGGTDKSNNSTQLWSNMSSSDPIDWTYIPNDGTTLSFGTNVGLSPDYFGNVVTAPVFMGVSQYGVVPVVPPTRITSMRRFNKRIQNKP